MMSNNILFQTAMWDLSQRRRKGHDDNENEDKPNPHKSPCTVVTVNSVRKIFPGYIQKQAALTEYCTGSTYEGQIDNLGFSGYGVYIYPHGVEYEGEFKDGQFHGSGTLKYPFGQTVDGVWQKGKLKKYVYKYSDGKQHYSKDWDYLRIPNRQYEAEKQEGFQPTGQEFISNNKPDPIIPPNTYDNADGSYYCPTNKLICWNDHRIRDIVRKEQDTFIKENFRQEVDEVSGYRPEFYEQWSSGRKADVDAYIKQFKQNNKDDDGDTNIYDIEKENTSYDDEIAGELYKNVRSQSSVYIVKVGHEKRIMR